MWVKGSGGDLGTLTEAGLAVLRLDRLRSLVDVYPGEAREDEMVAAFDFCLPRPGRCRTVDRHRDARPRPRRRTSTICIPTAASPSRPRPTANG